MQPEFSIRLLKNEQIMQAIKTIEKFTQCEISKFILNAFKDEDLDSYVAALDASMYAAFKTIIYQSMYIETIKRQLDNKNV